MRTYLNQCVELAWLALVSPGELALYIQNKRVIMGPILLFFSLIAFSNAIAIYYLRAYYTNSYMFIIPVFGLVLGLLLILGTYLYAAVLDHWIRLRNTSREASFLVTLQIVALTWIPGLFVLPAAVSSSVFSFKKSLFLLLLGLISFWSFTNMIQAIRYHYELEKSEARWACIVSGLGLLVFPGLLFLFGFLELAAFLV